MPAIGEDAIPIGQDAERIPAIGEDAIPIGADAQPIQPTADTGQGIPSPTLAEEVGPSPRFEEISATPTDWRAIFPAAAALGRLTDNILAPGSEHTTPLVSAAVADEAVRRAALPARIVARLGGMAEFEKGMEQSAKENVQGFATAESLASLPAFSLFGLYGMGETFALNVAAKLPDQFGRLKDAIQRHGVYSAETGKAALDAGIQDVFGFLAFKASPHLRENFATNIKKTIEEKGGDIIAAQRTIETDQGGFTSAAQQRGTEALRTLLQQEASRGTTQPSQPTPQDFIGTIPTDEGGFVPAQPTAAERGIGAGQQPAPERVDTGADQGPRSPDEIAAASGQGAEGTGGQGLQGGQEVITPTPETGAVQPPPVPEELLSPSEFDVLRDKREAEATARYREEARQRLAAGELIDPNKVSAAVSNERGALSDALRNNRPVNAALLDRYNEGSSRPLKIPDHYVKDGDIYRPKEAPPVTPAPIPLISEPRPLPPDDMLRDQGATHAIDLNDPQGNSIGSIAVTPTPKGIEVKLGQVDKSQQRKGTYPEAIRQLADKYGTATSDTDLKANAARAWEKAGAEKQDNGSWVLKSDRQKGIEAGERAAARMTRAAAPDGGYSSHPLIQFVMDSGGIMSKSTARKAWGKAKYELNKSLWDSAPEFPDPRHNKVYSRGGGETPDKVASDAVDAGLLPQGSDASDLFGAVQKVADASHRQAAIERGQSVAEKVAGKQAASFARAVAKPAKGESAINASDLQVGHTLKIRGEDFKVTDIDPDTFAVTLEDGSKFGVQTVADNQVIYGEIKGGVKRATQPYKAPSALPTEQRLPPEQRAEVPPQAGDTRPQVTQPPAQPPPVTYDPIDKAAWKTKDGTVVTGASHPTISDDQGVFPRAGAVPGFVTKSGKFLTSEQAYEHAIKMRQIVRDKDTKILEASSFEALRKDKPPAQPPPISKPFQDLTIREREQLARDANIPSLSELVKNFEIQKADNNSYNVLFNGEPAGSIVKGFSRLGGEGWTLGGAGKSHKTLADATRALADRTRQNLIRKAYEATKTQPNAIPTATTGEAGGPATEPAAPKAAPETVPGPVTPEALKLVSSDALRAMLPAADPVTRGRIAWELGNRNPSDNLPGAAPPTLRPGEKAGELFQGTDQPFNLAGEKVSEAEQKAAEERAQAEQDRKIHDEENQVPFGFGPGGASIHENLNVASQIKQLNATVSNALRTPRSLNPRAAFTKAYQAVGKQFVTAKQSLAGGLNNVRTSWQTMKTVLMRPPVVSDFIEALKDWHFADNKTSHEVRQFVRNVRKNLKSALIREAITNYIQADGDMAVLAARAAASNIKYRPGYEAAMKLTPEQQTFAANVRQYFDAMLADGTKAGLLDHGIENYVNQLWKKPNRISKALQADIQSGKLQTNFQFARRRIFDSFFEGEQKGFVPASKDISALIAVYDQSFNKALSARAFVAALRNAKTANGEALVKFSGMQTELLGQAAHDAENAGAYLVRSRAIPEPAVTKDGRSYVPVDHPALRGWKLVVQRHNAPGGFPDVYYQTDMLVHPDYAPKVRLPGSPLSLKSILEPSALRQGPIGVVTNPLLKVGAFAKQTKLSLSLFHLDQEGLHGLFHRIDPAHLDQINFDDPVQAMLVRNGLVVADYRAQELFTEGLAGGGLVTKVPILGKMQTAFNEFLFKDYIPKLKMNMALHAFERNMGRRAFKGLTPDQVAEITANQGNAAFGELNYRLLGRSQTFQDGLRLLILAPDFLEARSRFVGQAMKRYGGEQRAALILGTIISYSGARVMNQWLDGDPHWDKPFSVIYNKREYRLRTVMGDAVELMLDPVRFFNNRFSPWLKEGITVATQRDITTGIRLTRFEQLKHALAWFVPISMGGTEEANKTQRFLGASGVTNKPARGAIDDAYEAARDYKRQVAKQNPEIAAQVERAAKETYATSDYRKLNRALYENDRERAVAEMEKLIEQKGRNRVDQYYQNLPNKPFTGSAELERGWLRGIAQDQGQQARYKQAVADRNGMSRLFFKLRPYVRSRKR